MPRSSRHAAETRNWKLFSNRSSDPPGRGARVLRLAELSARITDFRRGVGAAGRSRLQIVAGQWIKPQMNAD